MFGIALYKILDSCIIWPQLAFPALKHYCWWGTEHRRGNVTCCTDLIERWWDVSGDYLSHGEGDAHHNQQLTVQSWQCRCQGVPKTVPESRPCTARRYMSAVSFQYLETFSEDDSNKRESIVLSSRYCNAPLYQKTLNLICRAH